jgi:hypothetical protein
MNDFDDDDLAEIEAMVAPQKVAKYIAGASRGLALAGASALGPLGAIAGTILSETWNAAAADRVDRVLRHHEHATRALVALVQELRAHATDPAALDAKIEERFADKAARAVLFNYAEQAYREPVEDRQRLLDHAAACIVDVDLTIAEHARVERAIRELDPDDVMATDHIARTCGSIFKGEHYDSAGGVRYEAWRTLRNADAVVAAGCVRITYGGTGGMFASSSGFKPSRGSADVTRLGYRVLRVCRSFIVPRRDPFAAPGRTNFSGSRSEGEARVVLGAERELVDSLRSLSRATTKRYDPPTLRLNANGKPVVEPEATTPGRLRFYRVPRVLTPKLLELFARSATFTLEVQGPADIDTCDLCVSGPHDVCRWLAEDLRAKWVA